MKRIALAALVLAGCRAAPPTERYGFVARLGNDTVAVESVTRTGNTLTSDETDRFPMVRERHTVITLGPNGGVERLVSDIHTPGDSAAHRNRRAQIENRSANIFPETIAAVRATRPLLTPSRPPRGSAPDACHDIRTGKI